MMLVCFHTCSEQCRVQSGISRVLCWSTERSELWYGTASL